MSQTWQTTDKNKEDKRCLCSFLTPSSILRKDKSIYPPTSVTPAENKPPQDKSTMTH